jgi:phosphoribosylaminoimidazolecarboxamide formyltransferase/IMP cyclohydrolase
MQLNRVNRIDDLVPVRRALVSVADKTGLEEFVEGLVRIVPDITIYSTGGTYRQIRETLGPDRAACAVQVSEYTGQPELQGGLVKTLDYKIYLGLLSETYNDSHRADLSRTGSVPIDLVVVNLYPFREAVSVEGATLEDARTHIDIGGPCMLRASAKNFLRVGSVCSPEDYPALLAELEREHGALSFRTRFELAKKAFAHTARYDARIAEYLSAVNAETAAQPYTFQGGHSR